MRGWAAGLAAVSATALGAGPSFTAPLTAAEGTQWELHLVRHLPAMAVMQVAATDDKATAVVKVKKVQDGRVTALEVTYSERSTLRELPGLKKTKLTGKVLAVEGYADDAAVRDAKGDLLDLGLTREVLSDVGALLGEDPLRAALKGKALKVGDDAPELVTAVLRSFVNPRDPDTGATEASATLKSVKDGRALFEVELTQVRTLGSLQLKTRFTGTAEVPVDAGWRSTVSLEGKTATVGELPGATKKQKPEAVGGSKVEYRLKPNVGGASQAKSRK